MPANLTPQYAKAEEEFKQAKSVEEKLACLKKMYTLMPKHKGTEKLQADLKTKMAQFRDEVEKQQAKGGAKKTAVVGHKIPKQGAGQVVILGAPNVGKSQLLAKLTRATPEVAAYPFTTREPQPGMMAWEDVFVQLIDTPPITPDYLEGYLQSMVRAADTAILMVDLADDDGAAAAEAVCKRLADTKTGLVGQIPDTLEDLAWEHVRTLLVANKADDPDAELRLEFVRAQFGERFPVHVISAQTGQGLDELRTTIFQFLNRIRVYTKQPGKPADMKSPYTLPMGSTVVDLAEVIHRELAEKLKNARIWGTGVYDGQSVSRDHELTDRDIVELHV